MRLQIVFLPILIHSAAATVFRAFSSPGCAGSSTPTYVFSQSCSSLGGGYPVALTTCSGGGTGPFELSLFFPSGGQPPDCSGATYATFAAPSLGACQAATGTAAAIGFASFLFEGDGASPPSCEATPTQGAFNVRFNQTACPMESTAFYTLPTVAAGGCSPAAFGGVYAVRAVLTPPTSIALSIFSDSTSCVGTPLSAWDALPLDKNCAPSLPPPASLFPQLAEALPLSPYTPTPPSPPPTLPGSGATLLLYPNASDCSGTPQLGLAAYTGLPCTAFENFGVALQACSPGVSASIALFNDSSPTALAPPTCTSTPFKVVTALIGACVELLSEGSGSGAPGRVMAQLAAAKCEVTPPNTLFLAANFMNDAGCAGSVTWGTVEVLPCANYNWAGLGLLNSATTFTSNMLTQRNYYGGGGCGGGQFIHAFENVPVDGSRCVDSSPPALGTASIRVVAPSAGAISVTPSASQPPPPGLSATATATDTQTPTPSLTTSSSGTTSDTPTPTPTLSPGASFSETGTGTASPPPAALTPTDSQTPCPTASDTPTPSFSPSPGGPLAPTETATETATPSGSPSPTPSASQTASPGAGPDASPSPSASNSAGGGAAPPPQSSGGSATAAAGTGTPSITASAGGGGGGGNSTGIASAGGLSPGAAGGVSFAVLAVLGFLLAWWWMQGGGLGNGRALRKARKARAAGGTSPQGMEKHPVFDSKGVAEVVQSPLYSAQWRGPGAAV